MSLTTCSLQSLEHDEAMAGTAPHAEHWLLVEYSGPWGKKALEESTLPTEAVERVVMGVPHGRLALIKQPGRAENRVYAVTCNPHRIFRYTIDAWADVDAAALFDGRWPGATVHSEPLFLVCTNGKRDRCCAELGLPVYQVLETTLGDKAWQTTHTGGHRFAANLVCLPHGIVYGRVSTENAPELVREYQAGRLDLRFCRGRSAYAPAVQAAEIFYRQAHQDPRLESLHVVHVETEGSEATVTFQDDGRVRVRGELSDFVLQASCGAPKWEPVMQFRPVD